MKKPIENPKPKPRILFMTIKKKWFDEIKAGTKKIEYRDYKPYWTRRLEGREYDLITFQNGYARNAPRITLKYIGYYIEPGTYCIMLGDLVDPEPDKKGGVGMTEKYIKENNIKGGLADALMDYEKGHKPLGDICFFYGIDTDLAFYHVKKISGEW